MRLAPLAAALLAAACGGSSQPRPRPPGPPPARVFVQAPATARVRVPELDRTPPLALLRLDRGGGAPAIVHDSPVRPGRGPVVRLPRPGFTATGLIRDTDGGTGRIRVSVEYVASCPRPAGGIERSQRAAYFPRAQIERIRLAPGFLAPTQRVRTARVRFPARCAVSGKVFAEATNAQGLESFSDPIWFSWTAEPAR